MYTYCPMCKKLWCKSSACNSPSCHKACLNKLTRHILRFDFCGQCRKMMLDEFETQFKRRILRLEAKK